MIFGSFDLTDGVATELASAPAGADVVVAAVPVGITKLSARLDGLGSGEGSVVLTATIRDQAATPNTLGVSDEVTVAHGDAEGWVDFVFSPALKLTVAGTFTCSLSVVSGDDTSVRALVVGAVALFLTGFDVYVPPDNEAEAYYGRLPYVDAQAKFSETVTKPTVYRVHAGWHGTLLERETGSFCVVRDDGPLAGFVGHRLKVTASDQPRQRSVTVFCNAATNLIVDDISLSRRSFGGIAPLSSMRITAKVEVLA